MKVRNTFIIFLVSGFWHGANWTFIVWGGLNALYFLPLLLLKRNRTNLGVVAEGRMLPTLREVFQMGTTFLLTVLAWVFFRAESVNKATDFVKIIFSKRFEDGYTSPYGLVILILVLLWIDWLQRSGKTFNNSYVTIFILVSLALFVNKTPAEFIYFDF